MPKNIVVAPRFTATDVPPHEDHRRGTALRRLGAIERFFFLLDRHRSFNHALAAEIRGRTTVAEWRAAVDAMQRRHPLLSAAIDATVTSAPLFVRTPNRRIPLRIVAASRREWEVELAHQLSRPFDPAQGPLLRITVVMGEDAATCILVAHHSIADGMSLAFLLRDTLRALSGSHLPPLPLSPAMEDSLPPVSAPPAPEEAPRGPFGSPRDAAEKASPIEHLQMSAERTVALRQRARDEDTTLHGALCAALVLAARRLDPALAAAPLRLLSPINIRGMVGAADACGNFIGLGIAAFPADAPADFWALARHAKAEIVPAQTPAAVAAGSLGQSLMLHDDPDPSAMAEMFAQGIPHELALTNLTALPIEAHYGALELEAVWGPWVLPRQAGSPVIGAATINGKMCLSRVGCARLPGLLTTADGALTSALR